MASDSVADRLKNVPLKTLQARLPEDRPNLKKVQDAGKLVQTALARAGMSQKEAALAMGLRESQLADQLAGTPGNHLSWQRLQMLPDAFFVELLIILAERKGIATVRMQLNLERKVGA